jgi:hypothetical protein
MFYIGLFRSESDYKDLEAKETEYQELKKLYKKWKSLGY